MSQTVQGETKTYCEVLYPGIFFSENDVFEVNYRDPNAIAIKHKNAFAFQFFDQERTQIKVGSKTQTVSGERKNESDWYYPGGQVFTLEQVKQLDGDYRTLISNMECNGYASVVRTRCGNFQPFDGTKARIL